MCKDGSCEYHSRGRRFVAETLALVTFPETCIIWPYGTDGRGYPVLGNRSGSATSTRNVKVSHLMLEATGHPRPGRLHALHACDTPRCINPVHLKWGTNKQNQEEKMSRGRWRLPAKIGATDVA